MKDKKPFIIEIVIGILFAGAGLLTKFDYYSTLIFAIGCGILSSSIVQLIRIVYWQNPKRNSEYQAKLLESHISKVDERKQYLRMKAGYLTYQIMAFATLSVSFVLALFRANPWVTGMMFLLFLLHWIIGIVIYQVLEKKL